MKPPLKGMSLEDYYKVRASGMMGGWYPEATWNYDKDCGGEDVYCKDDCKEGDEVPTSESG